MDENLSDTIIYRHNNEKISNAMGPNLQILAFGIAEVLQPDFHLKTWTFIQSGLVCFVKDCLKKKYYLNVYNFFNNSEDTKLLLNMEISKRLIVCMKTANFVTFCDSLDKNDYVGTNFLNSNEAREFFNNCDRVQKRRSSRFKFLTSINNSSNSLTYSTPDMCQLLSSSSSISSGSLNDQMSKFKKLWNINPIRLFKKKAFSKSDSFTVTPNSSFKEEIDEFKDRIIKSNSPEINSLQMYSKRTSPIPAPVKNTTLEKLSRKGTIRSTTKNSKKLPKNGKTLLNARNSIKVNKNKLHQRSTLGSIKTLKIQKRASNNRGSIGKEKTYITQNEEHSDIINNFSRTIIPQAPPLPEELNFSKTKTSELENENDKSLEVKILPRNQYIPDNLINEIKNMSINNLKKVDKCDRNLLNTNVCEKLSVMEVLKKNLPVRRSAFEPEESDDDVDSAWSSSNYHSDSDF